MPYSYPTTPGVTYAVECAAEVFVTNPQTGAVAVSGDGSATVYFTATDTLYDISDDSAKVQPLFKLAPRLRLTLLQGVAGGWLPKGYVELEYLESSGTQYIDTGVYLSNLHNVSLTMQQTQNEAVSGAVFGSQDESNATNYAWSIYGESGARFGWFFYKTLSQNVLQSSIPSYTRFDLLRVEVADGRLKINDSWLTLPTVEGAFTAANTCWLFSRNSYSPPTKFIGKIFSFEITGAERMKLIPALRNADSAPGMWDTVSKSFFTNAGSGTFGYRITRTGETVAPMALRDPYRVAPSGVWARPAGEKELEVVADTEEVSGDDWLHFANTAEAYEHFGIVPQEDELLTE